MGSASPLAQKLFLSDLPKEASRGLFPSCFHGKRRCKGKGEAAGKDAALAAGAPGSQGAGRRGGGYSSGRNPQQGRQAGMFLCGEM